MDLKSFYEKVGGDYNEIRSRLPTDKLIEKFVLMIPKDPCYVQLKEGFEKQNWQEAFNASHTLKGVAANLALKTLYTHAAALTEDLRSGTPAPTAQENYEKVKEIYEKVVSAIEEGGAQC